ncbi:MAG: sulfite exporter TauE/SafE family protein [Aggregatilineales bacterium]
MRHLTYILENLMPVIVAAAIILFLGSLVQGMIGFAFGLLAVPLLISTGFSLAQAVALSTLSIGIQVMFGAHQLREHIPWQHIKLAVIIRYLTVPIGIVCLLAIDSLDTDSVKRFVGIAVLCGVIVRLFTPDKQVRDLPIVVSIATFSLSGFLQGLIAMGGPPVILWLTTCDFTAKQARAFTMTLFLFNAPVQVFLLLVLSQTMTPAIILLALMLSPLIFIGTRVGVYIGNRFSRTLLNNLAMATLCIIALNAIF